MDSRKGEIIAKSLIPIYGWIKAKEWINAAKQEAIREGTASAERKVQEYFNRVSKYMTRDGTSLANLRLRVWHSLIISGHYLQAWCPL